MRHCARLCLIAKHEGALQERQFAVYRAVHRAFILALGNVAVYLPRAYVHGPHVGKERFEMRSPSAFCPFLILALFFVFNHEGIIQFLDRDTPTLSGNAVTSVRLPTAVS